MSRAVVLLLCLLLPGGCSRPVETPFDPGRMDAARDEARALLALLEDYYGGAEVLRDTWLRPPEAPGQAEGLRFLADKIARAVVWQDGFVVGAIGSSVTVGTGSCAYDSYPRQLERLLAPVFRAAGARIEVRNAGQNGHCGDSYRNQVWCLPTLVGDDADVVHYSWTYFETEPAFRHHEVFYRWALGMPHAPVPQLLYAHNCEELPPEDHALLERYGRFGANALCMTRGIEKAGYPGKEWGVVGDTLHDTTRYGEAASVPPERRRSLGVVFRNWHPGPLLFQTTADALAWQYAQALLLALGEISAEPDPGARWPREPARGDLALGDPLSCDPDWCGSEAPPRCAYYQEPRYGENRVDLAGETIDPETGRPGSPAPGWRHWRGGPDWRMPEGERPLPECQHRNFCAGFAAEPGVATDWLVFRLPPLELGRVSVCCSSDECGQKLLDAEVELELDGERVEAAEPTEKCLVARERFSGSWAPSEAGHELRLRLPARERPPPAITHVFGL